jgi:hypothetical protein
MDSGNFISQLRDIRSNLHEAVRLADNFDYKLLGPRPAEGNTAQLKQGPDSIASLLTDINALSLRLPKMLEHQHAVIGEFSPKDDCASPQLSAPQNRYA